MIYQVKILTLSAIENMTEMTGKEILNTQKEIYKSLAGKQIKKTFELLYKLTEELQDWSINEKLNELETSYKYMLQYLFDGVEDPKRDQIYTGLIASLFNITDKIAELLLEKETSTFYYSKKRYYRLHPEMNIQQQMTLLDTALSNMSLNDLLSDIENNTQTQNDLKKQVEKAEEELFVRIWCNYPATEDDYSILREGLSPQHFPAETVCLIISALTLNLLHRYDERKLSILLDVYEQSENEDIRQRALCGALILMYIYRTRISFSPTLLSRIEACKENEQFCRETRTIFLQLIKSRETERISRKFTEELLPEMMKISPSIYNKMKQDELMNDMNSLEKNPEWQEILEKSGIADKLKELNDLQLEGADVFMSTFSGLKSFPFFKEAANWFRPFNTGHTMLNSVFPHGNKDSNFKKLISMSHFLCNSDKYSFCLSLTQVPEAQREMMTSQFNAEGIELQNIEKDRLSLNANEVGKNISNQYLQDLYRFFKLSLFRPEFSDPFASHIDLFQISFLQSIFSDDSTLRLIGEFYFRKEYYTDALTLFEILLKRHHSDSELYQKVGYCLQMSGQYQEALQSYLKAEMIYPDSLWTLRRIASCYRTLKKPEAALEYYLRIEQMNPDNLSIEMNIGHCYFEQENYEEALKHYFKVDYLDPRSAKAWRAIAWCSFLAGKLEQAQRYYGKILDNKPTAIDYMNAGHVEFVLKNLNKAIMLYRESITREKGKEESFLNNFRQDVKYLTQLGISSDDIPLLIDQLLYSLSR